MLVALLLGIAGGPALAAADPATPSPTPDVPPAELCLTTAPSLEALNAAIAAVAANATPAATRTPGVVPEGVPADAATVAGVIATLREFVACFNAGEPLRAYALYTAAYLGRIYARQGPFTADAYASLATPRPEPDTSKHTAILSIVDVRTFPDGSAGATVTFRYASIPVPKRFFVTFVRAPDGTRWLIDGILGEISFSVG